MKKLLLLAFATLLFHLTYTQDTARKTEREKMIAPVKGEVDQLLDSIKKLDSLIAKSKQKQIDSLRLVFNGVPIVPFKDTLFRIYLRSGNLNPAERAGIIEERIRNIESLGNYHSDSLNISSVDVFTDILYGDQIIMTVAQWDAMWMKSDRDSLAQAYRDIIDTEIRKHREAFSPRRVMIDIAFTIGMLILLVLIFALVNFIFRHLNKWLYNKNLKMREKDHQGRFLFMDAGARYSVIKVLLNLFRFAVLFMLIIIALPFFFSMLPWTRHLSNKLFSLLLNPLRNFGVAIVEYLDNLVTIIILITLLNFVLKGLDYFRKEIETGQLKIKGFYPEWAMPTYSLLKILVFAFGLVIIFPYLPGSDSAVFKGVTVFLGFLVTFGSGSAISNLFSGIMLIYMRNFKKGDFVKIGDVMGTVIEHNLIVTRLETPKQEDVVIPNSQILNRETINYSANVDDRGLIVHTSVTIGYDVPWVQVHELLIKAATRCSLLSKEPIPFVLQIALNDFYVQYEINAFTKNPNLMPAVYSELHQNIQDSFFEAGVEIMSPHYTSLRDGNTTTIPQKNLPPDYQPKSFRVNKD